MRFAISRKFLREGSARSKESVISETDLMALREIGFQISHSLGSRPFAFAPIRSRPERTYDPLKDVPKPEGSHVPMVLAKTLSGKSKESEGLRLALRSFGEASGLFKSVEVKRKGKKDSDPFQIGVKTMGQSFNLVDVGYGVSQVLPIIVDVILNAKGSSFLLQQPEVHLHPKAQAELGSFLASLAKEQDKQFLIETHSDYLIDRIRMDIRDKKQISADDVAILYFERSKSGVQIHQLDLDEFGNIKNAPPTYRRFFLDEERRLFGI
jgi:predicted ATP-dependent endonuclease of OLD family